jgi:hypothetical protein
MTRLTLAFTCFVLAIGVAACGGDDESTPAPSPAAASAANQQAIKDYLLEHTTGLVRSVEILQRDAQQYYDLAESTEFDYARMLRDNRDEVQVEVRELQAAHVQANPAYEEMEEIVAGVPSLAGHDVIIDAGGDKSDPENAVPFSLKTPAGRSFEQPGNLFALVETSVYGTEPKFVAEGVEPDLDGDGKVTFPEALPDADFLLAASSSSARTSSTRRRRPGRPRSGTRSRPWS